MITNTTKMELREYVEIIKKNFKIFVAILTFFVLAGIAWQWLYPHKYKAVMNLAIARDGIQQTQDYRYDDFYRLQADEKFGENVVHWLRSPKIALDIYRDAGMQTDKMSHRALSKAFNSKQMSAQFVKVSYAVSHPTAAKSVSVSILKIINRETKKLNNEQPEKGWFVVVGEEPVVKNERWPWGKTLLASCALGLFFASWLVIIRHYFKG